MAGGRPTKYKLEYNEQVYKLCLLGATDKELATFFNICNATIENWKQTEPEFLVSLKKGKEEADSKVVKKLLERATGYEHKEDKFFVIDGEVVTQKTTKHYPPDTTALIFWLKNRRPKNWRDKTEQKVTVSGALDSQLIEGRQRIAEEMRKKEKENE